MKKKPNEIATSTTLKDLMQMIRAELARSPLIQKLQSEQAEAEQIVLTWLNQNAKKGGRSHWDRAELYSSLKEPVTEVFTEQTRKIARQRAEGYPLQYLLGYQFFGENDYDVKPHVFIPRPETETLLRTLLCDVEKGDIQPETGMEIGLGSGALTIELLKELPWLKMLASEISDEAIELAWRNAQRNLNLRYEALQKRLKLRYPSGPRDILAPFQQDQVDFIISNPPYLGSWDEVESDVARYEPRLALYAPDDDPLLFYRELAGRGQSFLKEKGKIYLEIPSNRAKIIQELFINQGWNVELIRDLTERERVLKARMN